MNPAVDLFTPPKRFYSSSEHDEFIGYQYRNVKRKLIDKETGECIGFKTELNYSADRHLVQGEREHYAENFKFVDSDNFENIGKSIDKWLEPFEQRVKTEKALVKYIREKVAPYHPVLFKVADKMEQCRNSGTIGLTRQKDDSHIIAWDKKCSESRLCPHEAGAEAKRLERFYLLSIYHWLEQRRSRRIQKAVFTIPNVEPGKLHEAIRDIYKSFNKLRKRKVCHALKGVLTSMECPLSVDGDWNVHLNVLMGIEGDFNWEDIQREWSEIIDHRAADGQLQNLQVKFTSQSEMERITRERFGLQDVSKKQVLTAAIRECIKYPAKHVTSKSHSGQSSAPGMNAWPPERFIEFYEALKRYRRTRSYDQFYLGSTRIEHEKIDFTRVQWAGSVDFNFDINRYAVTLAGRPVISIQGDKSTKNKHQNGRQMRLSDKPPPNG